MFLTYSIMWTLRTVGRTVAPSGVICPYNNYDNNKNSLFADLVPPSLISRPSSLLVTPISPYLLSLDIKSFTQDTDPRTTITSKIPPPGP